jgi:hypothetical protein
MSYKHVASPKPNPRIEGFKLAEALAKQSAYTRLEDSPIDPEDYGPLTDDIRKVDKELARLYKRAGIIGGEDSDGEGAYLYGLAVGLQLGRGGAR